MPAAQRLLDEHGLQASDIEATGPGGRLLKGDVLRHVESGNGKAPPEESTPAPTAKPTPSGVGGDRPTPHADASSGAGGTSGGGDREEELVPMTPLRRSIAQRLVDAQQTAALLTTFNDCDMTAVMDLRKRHQDAFVKRYGIKLGFMSIFVKATIHALSQFPALNAEVRGTDIAYRNYFDIGIAIGGGKGLVVPIIRDAQTLSLAQIEQQIADYAQKAKANKITLDDMTGGTFTITNGGIYGSLLSTPIVNPPQSGVLGMHNIVRRPIAVGDPKTGDERIEIRPMMNLALTYDHRVVDGREAVTALRLLKEAIEEPARMLIEI
jgi:2-oxoglutarate dehydrogenase E2 component (dihydrolipoamide succinyltransferase)